MSSKPKAVVMPTPPRRALGRGLAALLPETHDEQRPVMASVPTSEHTSAPTLPKLADAGFRMLPIDKVRPNPQQPRKYFDAEALGELTASIKRHGVLQPILVQRRQNHYEIIAGERRFRAAKQAGILEIPAMVKTMAPQAQLIAALIENIQRQDLDPLEEARAYEMLIKEHRLTHEQVAEAVGKKRVTITNSLRLLKLPPAVMALVGEGKLSAGHARLLIGLNANVALPLAEAWSQQPISVRQAEAQLRKGLHQHKSSSANSKPKDVEQESLQARLSQKLGTQVTIHQSAGRGYLKIAFVSLEALDGILERIDGLV